MNSTENKGRTLRAAVVGTGYIADFHVRGIALATDVDLVAVCDADASAAKAFAAKLGVPAYTSVEDMLEREQLDTLHILTPPDTHYSIAKAALEKQVHVLLEKPMCITAAECADLVAKAREVNRIVAVSQSLVFEGAFARLRDAIASGMLGPIDHVAINLFVEIGLIRVGPFGSWMLREGKNIMLEVGPHPLSALLDLLGDADDLEATADKDIVLPGGARVYQRWRIHSHHGRTSADITIDVGPGFQQRTVAVRGLSGVAYVDLDANTCTIDRLSPAGVDFDRRRRSLDQARQIRRQANATLLDYVRGKAKLGKRSGPFANSIQDSVAAFVTAARGGAVDPRISGEFGTSIIAHCEKIIAKADLKPGEQRGPTPVGTPVKPTVLVIGGTGFIGRELIRQLLEQGYVVRAAARRSNPLLEELGSDRLEIARADMRLPAAVDRILEGIDTVFHLATAPARTWDEYRENEVEPTRFLAEAALKRGVRRLIYTGTIDSYYAGKKAGTITADTPLDRRIKRRNYYARAKAASEAVLTRLHRECGLPLVIVRPGIVIGKGGNPFHWGVGKWTGSSVVELWGKGTNALPLVLVEDVAAGLIKAMQTPDIEGRSYNLIDAPLMSAHEYVNELEQVAGFRVDQRNTSIGRFYGVDMAKWLVKVLVRHPDRLRVPSYHDWESRTQRAHFDNAQARGDLGWQPASNVDALKKRGIKASLAGWLNARL